MNAPVEISSGRQAFFRVVATVIGFAIALLACEIGFRLMENALFKFGDMRPDAWSLEDSKTFEYDPELGWIPRPGVRQTRAAGWITETDQNRMRLNSVSQNSMVLAQPPLLAVGDSTAFGDEVNDNETWPARLEQRLQRRVLNAGVSAYGIDQAVLRAERLLPRYSAPVVVLSVVSDDVTRTALSFHNHWRPFFRIENGHLIFTPAPPPQVPVSQSRWMDGLGYSYFVKFVTTRVFRSAWEHRIRRRVHNDEREVSGRLLSRLKMFADEHDSNLLVVFIVGGNADTTHFPDLLQRAGSSGVTVLDLSDELVRFARDDAERERMFRPHYHLSPIGNTWVAERIATRLLELGWIDQRI